MANNVGYQLMETSWKLFMPCVLQAKQNLAYNYSIPAGLKLQVHYQHPTAIIATGYPKQPRPE